MRLGLRRGPKDDDAFPELDESTLVRTLADGWVAPDDEDQEQPAAPRPLGRVSGRPAGYLLLYGTNKPVDVSLRPDLELARAEARTLGLATRRTVTVAAVVPL